MEPEFAALESESRCLRAEHVAAMKAQEVSLVCKFPLSFNFSPKLMLSWWKRDFIWIVIKFYLIFLQVVALGEEVAEKNVVEDVTGLKTN